MKIAICDDEKIIREELVYLIKKQEIPCEINLYQSGKELLETQEEWDILFLDIQMDGVNGIEAARKIREKQQLHLQDGITKRTIIIFVTGLENYMQEAFDVNAFHYLLKPIKEEKFTKIFLQAEKEVEIFSRKAEKFVVVKAGNISKRIYLRDIYYLESNNKKITIHTLKSETTYYGKMEDIIKQLGEDFFRCHRSFIVNMEYIDEYEALSIKLDNGDEVAMSKQKYPEFVKTYMRYIKREGAISG